MPGTAAVLNILVSANTAQATAAMGKMQGQLVATDAAAGKSTKTAASHGAAWKKGGLVAAAGIGVAVVAVKGFVKAAEESQVSQMKMSTQLKALGISYKAHAKEIDKVIQKTSKLSGLDDEDLQDSFTNIVRVTKDVSQALKLNALAADIARARHISLSAASKMVTRAATGSAAAFSRVGITVAKADAATGAYKAALEKYKETHKKLTPEETARFERLKATAKAQDAAATSTELIADATKRFSGQAKAYGETAAGAQDRFKVATENLQESLGKALLPVITKVANALANAAGWLEENKGVATVLGATLGGLAVTLGVIKVATLSYQAATTLATAAQWLLNAAVSANPYVLAVVGVVALGAAIYVFRDKIMSVFNWLKDHWPEIATIISGPFAPLTALATNGFGVRSALISAFESAGRGVKSAMSDMVDFIANIPDRLLGLVKAAGNAASAFTRPIIDAFHDVKDIIVKVWTWVEKLIDGVKDAVGWIGKIKIPDLNPLHAIGIGGAGGGNVGPGVKLGGSGVDQFNSVASKFGNVITSGYRPGDDGYHGQNRARDYAGGNMLAFAKFMASTYGSKLTELIHTPLGYGIKNGQKVGLGFWGNAVNADHFDHVHVALAKGGIVTKPTVALMGEAGPEAVIPLSGRNGFGGVTNVYVTVQPGFIGDEEQLADKLVGHINRKIARDGQAFRQQTT